MRPEGEDVTMTHDDQTEPTLGALEAAVEQVRAANHHAYFAPALPSDLYARTRSLVELLDDLQQVAFTLGNHVERSSSDAMKDGLVLDTDDGLPVREYTQEARRLLADAVAAVEQANRAANQAWSALSHLKLTKP
jgi:hypothetical protein